MKKIIIRTREQHLTSKMLSFGYSCADSFIHDLNNKTYGDNWDSCGYYSHNAEIDAYVKLYKSGTVSVLVSSEGLV